MEAAMVEMSASGPRERLLAFVDEVVRPLPHVRQRENALLYVRGLIEHGGRKSLQPTLFRLEETPARYESMQQFLADSPWDPAGVVRACAERVAPEIGVLAWGLAAAPLLAGCAYGDDPAFRRRLHTLEREYVLAVSAQISVYGPETNFAVPERKGPVGRRRSVARPDRKPESVRALAERLPTRAWRTLPCRTTPAGEDVSSRFA